MTKQFNISDQRFGTRTHKHHPIDEDLLKEIKKEKLGRIDNYDVWIVNGAILRDKIDIDYTTGGNCARYGYIPINEIWIEEDNSPKDLACNLFHELIECYLMLHQHMTYNKAHEKIDLFESILRNRIGSNVSKDEIIPLIKNIYEGWIENKGWNNKDWINKKAYYQGTEEPKPGQKQYKSDKAIIVQPRFVEPFYRNFDYCDCEGVSGPPKHGPGTGVYKNMDEIKSIEEFRKSKEWLNNKYKADDQYIEDTDKNRNERISRMRVRASIMNEIMKTAIDFAIDEQITSIPQGDYGTGDEMGSYSDSVPIGGRTDQYTPGTDFDGKTTDKLNYGVDQVDNRTERETYKKEEKKPKLEELLDRYLSPREPAIFGLPDGIETPEDLDPESTIAPNQQWYGTTDSGNTLHNNFPENP